MRSLPTQDATPTRNHSSESNSHHEKMTTRRQPELVFRSPALSIQHRWASIHKILVATHGASAIEIKHNKNSRETFLAVSDMQLCDGLRLLKRLIQCFISRIVRRLNTTISSTRNGFYCFISVLFQFCFNCAGTNDGTVSYGVMNTTEKGRRLDCYNAMIKVII